MSTFPGNMAENVAPRAVPYDKPGQSQARRTNIDFSTLTPISEHPIFAERVNKPSHVSRDKRRANESANVFRRGFAYRGLYLCICETFSEGVVRCVT